MTKAAKKSMTTTKMPNAAPANALPLPTPAADVAACLRRITTAHDSCPFEK